MTNNSERDQRKSSSLTVWLIAAVVMLPIAYVLSLGPAIWLYEHSVPLQPYIAVCYWPIESLAMICEPLGKVLDWYVSLWR